MRAKLFSLDRARTVAFLALILPAVLSTDPAHAGAFDGALLRTSYQAFSADMNGDGLPDVLLKAMPGIVTVPLDAEVNAAISVAPASPSFILFSNPGSGYTLAVNPDPALRNHSAWAASTHELLYGDVLGNRAGTLLIKAKQPHLPSAVVAMSASNGQLWLMQPLSVDTIGINVGDAGISLELKDQNNDGRTDLQVLLNGRRHAMFIANENGRFVRDDKSMILATWSAMLSALAAGDAEGAAQFIAVETREQYRSAFADLGGATKTIVGDLTEFDFVEIGRDMARCVVTQTAGGKTRMHFVSFLARDGGWMLLEF